MKIELQVERLYCHRVFDDASKKEEWNIELFSVNIQRPFENKLATLFPTRILGLHLVRLFRFHS